MDNLAARIDRIKPSPTLAVTQRAHELRASGVDVISFSAGEPDFDTPAHIIQAAKDALDQGMTRYTPVAGIPELRRAIATDSAKNRSVECDDSQVIVTVGAKHALFGVMQALIEAGDEVIVPAPYWVSYPDQVRLAGGEPVIVETRADDGWMLTAEQLAAACTPRTKAIIINSPSNPSGALYSPEGLRALVAAALERGLFVLSDEIYRDLVYDGAECVSALSVADPSARERVVVFDGVSKTFAMTGWRIGWAIAAPAIVKATAKIQSQSTSNASSMAQAAALAAITGPRDFLGPWKEQYVRRRDAMVGHLREMAGVSCRKPQGAFYVLPEVSTVLNKMDGDATDVELATYLLDEARIAAVPGSAFGAPGHLRLSYATSLEAIETGLERMAQALAKL